MRRFLSVAIFVSAILGGASAQMRVSQGTRFNTNLVDVGSSYLLAPSVQKELKISPEVSKKIQAKFMASFSKIATPNAGKGMTDRTKMIEDLRKSQAEIVGMLNPAQKARLKQIVLQQMGASGMLHPEVKPTLKLTPDQERKIGAIVRDGTQAMFSGMSKGPSGGPSGAAGNANNYQQQIRQMQSKQAEWRTRMTTLALKQLTPAQQSQWKAMCGKPFTLDYSGMMNPFAGRGMVPAKRGG